MGQGLPLFADVFSVFAALVLVMLCFMVIVALTAIVLGRMAYRRVRADARLHRTALTLRATFTPPGPQRSLIRLRLRLADAILGANDALAILRAHGAVQGDMAHLVRRVNRTAATLDAQLRLIQSEPDAGRARDAVAQLGVQVTAVEGIVRHVREAAYVVLDGDTTGTTAMLTHEVAREVSALQAGIATLHTATADAPVPVPLRKRKESYL